mgnify:CR=1 FL=1
MHVFHDYPSAEASMILQLLVRRRLLLTLFGISRSGDALAKEEEVIVDSTSDATS